MSDKLKIYQTAMGNAYEYTDEWLEEIIEKNGLKTKRRDWLTPTVLDRYVRDVTSGISAPIQKDTLGATKKDQGKPRYDLIPPHALEALAHLYGTGAAKYGDRNWEQGFTWGRVFRALMSHAWAWWKGEKNDPVDGQHHMIAVAWNAFALYEHERRTLGMDDRPPR